MCGVQEKAIKTSVYSLYMKLFVWEFKNISFLSGTELAPHKQQRFKVSKCSAESSESALPGSEAFGLQRKWQLLCSAPWAGEGLRPPWGPGWIWRTAVGPVPGHGLPGRGPRTHVREDTCEGGSCTRPGRDEGKTVPFQRQSLRKPAIPAGACVRFPDGYNDDSSRISYSALGLLLLVQPAAWSAFVSRCTRSCAGLAVLP